MTTTSYKYRVIHKNVSTRKSLIARVVEIGAVWTDQHKKANEMWYHLCENQSHQHPTDVATHFTDVAIATSVKCRRSYFTDVDYQHPTDVATLATSHRRSYISKVKSDYQKNAFT